MKEKLGGVLQYWFWIATGLVGLVSVGMWWVSSGKLIEEYEQAASQLDSDASKITSVRNSLGTHPNSISHAEMQKLVDARTDSVMQAWTSVFERQQDILVWPTEELKQDFVDEFADLIPIELKVPFPTPEEEEKLPALRTRYQNYIGSVLPSIAEIAKTKWTADFDARRGGMGDMGMSGMMGGGDFGGEMMGGEMPGMGMPGLGPVGAKDDGPLVNWNAQSQEQLLSDLFPWRGGRPTTLDVLYSQENLWILRQLMQIIAIVNGDVGQRFQAKIREIDRIAIGSSVPKSAGAISDPGSTRAAGGGMGMEGMDGMMEMGGMEEMMMGEGGGAGMGGMGGEGAEPVARDPGDNRYVDTLGEPLAADQLRSALSSNSPTDAFMAVAKRVPVMMQLKIDQRSIPELLAVCGSVPLMVEIKHVRVLPPGGSSVAPAGGGGMGMGGMGMDMPGGDMFGGGEDMFGGGEDMYGGDMGGMGGMGVAVGGRGNAGAFPMDMTVEVYGIIYIYNPPNSEALGIEQVDETTVIDGSSMGGDSPPPSTTNDGDEAPSDAEPAAVQPPAVVDPAVESEPPATEPPATVPDPAVGDPAVVPASPPGGPTGEAAAPEAGAMRPRTPRLLV